MRTFKECPECLGDGRLDVSPANSPSQARYVTCEKCGSSGEIEAEPEETEDSVSPYLMLPLRTVEEAMADIAQRKARS